MEHNDEYEVEPHLRLGREEVPQEQREEIIQVAFEAMRAGSTLNAAALQCGVSPSSVWRWIFAQEEHKVEYERLKTQRSQALMEHALYEMQCARTVDDARIAEKRAKLYMMQAAKLNPKEFSDRMHSMTGMSRSAQRISFTLNLGQAQSENKGELTVIAQPEDDNE